MSLFDVAAAESSPALSLFDVAAAESSPALSLFDLAAAESSPALLCDDKLSIARIFDSINLNEFFSIAKTFLWDDNPAISVVP